MRIIILDLQSQLYAKAVRRMLAQDIGGDNIVIVNTPEETPDVCRVMQPYALLMEVTAYSPWMLSERLNTCSWVRHNAKACKIVLLVDDAAENEMYSARHGTPGPVQISVTLRSETSGPKKWRLYVDGNLKEEHEITIL